MFFFFSKVSSQSVSASTHNNSSSTNTVQRSQIMPVRRRRAPCSRVRIVPHCFSSMKTTSLGALGTLAVLRPWAGVQSFVVPIGGGIIDAPSATTPAALLGPTARRTRTTAAEAAVGPRIPLGRCWNDLPGRRGGVGGLVVKASLDDDEDDEFDTVRFSSCF